MGCMCSGTCVAFWVTSPKAPLLLSVMLVAGSQACEHLLLWGGSQENVAVVPTPRMTED